MVICTFRKRLKLCMIIFSGDINEMEISLDHANKANVETSKQIKRLANNLLEIDTAAEEEARARADIEDQIGISERKGTYTYSYF